MEDGMKPDAEYFESLRTMPYEDQKPSDPYELPNTHKACPCCGNPSKLWTRYNPTRAFPDGCGGYEFQMRCTQCIVQTVWCMNEGFIDRYWDNRLTPA